MDETTKTVKLYFKGSGKKPKAPPATTAAPQEAPATPPATPPPGPRRGSPDSDDSRGRGRSHSFDKDPQISGLSDHEATPPPPPPRRHADVPPLRAAPHWLGNNDLDVGDDDYRLEMPRRQPPASDSDSVRDGGSRTPSTIEVGLSRGSEEGNEPRRPSGKW